MLVNIMVLILATIATKPKSEDKHQLNPSQWCYDVASEKAYWLGIPMLVDSAAEYYFNKYRLKYQCQNQDSCSVIVLKTHDTITFPKVTAILELENNFRTNRDKYLKSIQFKNPYQNITQACESSAKAVDGIMTYVDKRNKSFIEYEFTQAFFNNQIEFLNRKFSVLSNLPDPNAAPDTIISKDFASVNDIITMHHTTIQNALDSIENGDLAIKSTVLKNSAIISNTCNDIIKLQFAYTINWDSYIERSAYSIKELSKFPEFNKTGSICVQN